MKYVIIWKYLPADSAAVTIPPYDDDAPLFKAMTEDECVQWVIEHIVQKHGGGVDAPYALRPWDEYYADPEMADRTFREAWDFDGTNINVNMTKARVIHLAEIRKVRNAELVKEDVTFMRAVEEGDTDAQATIKTKKQTLRDLPATFDITTDADTPEQLKAKWPTELPARE